jgi:cytosine/adenosine deaminase-related metal-dependent hydrolase/SAM-dependent methyltransferase
MSTCSTTRALTAVEGYKVWASTYDQERNPMLSLEQRILERVLPPLAGLDIVDLGCGTGRWLYALRGSGARSFQGVDPSAEMLSRARSKIGGAVRFTCADFANAPLLHASADVVFCNFVLSYLEEAAPFFSRVRRILRPGGLLFVSDVHPETARLLRWRRGIKVQTEFQEIRTYSRDIAYVIDSCRNARFEIDLRLEPNFGEAERLIFEENGKGKYFDEISEYPPIYLLQLRAPKKRTRTTLQENKPPTVERLHGGRFALGPADGVVGEMRLQGGLVRTLQTVASQAHTPSSDADVDLRGFMVLPGLINAHDHLEFALFPRMGKGGYKNCVDWAEDIHRSYSQEIARHRGVPKPVRLWWGGIRNLLCGVTAVCHHNPYDPKVFNEEFLVRVLRNFGWAHSLSLDSKAILKKKTTRKGYPFFIHLAEGIDPSSRGEIFKLHRGGALNEDTVIIHGVGMEAKGKALLREAGAGLIWCPSSNLFLFGKAIPEGEIRGHPNVALGSDSPLTAAGDLLDEVSCAHSVLKATATDLYEYVTSKAAKLLRMTKVTGSLQVGSTADMVVVRDSGRTPAETLVSLTYQEVQLVLIGGRIQLASAEMKHRLPACLCAGLQPLSIDGTLRWIRAPLAWLFAETKAHLGDEILLGRRQLRFGT